MVALLERVIGSTVFGPGHEKIGQVKDVYLDSETGAPTWATVDTGWFSTDSLVPLAGSELGEDDSLEIPVDKEAVKSAPHHGAGAELTVDQQQELFRHYGVTEPQPGWFDAQRDRSTSGTEPITRSEERLDVGTESRPTGKAHLRKYVVTETQSVEIPVSREEARIVHEPITDPSEDQPDLGDESREVTLHADQVQVNKQAVPVEKVRLEVDDVEDTRSIEETVRKERIESDSAERSPDRDPR